MDDQERRVRRLVEQIEAGKIGVEEAVDQLLDEMSRGSKYRLLVDQNCIDLAVELADMGYTVRTVGPRESDPEIKERAHGSILITRNGEHFRKPVDRNRYQYSLIWVLPPFTPKLTARRVEKALMTGDFRIDRYIMRKV